jgi:UDP-N-acetylglucosamine 2-epimerase (non-hydrolysing)
MICTVVGARPNFIKMAPVILEARWRGLPLLFVHTGQHYDAPMSAIFFEELGMPQPDVYLGVGSGTHAEQTARIMISFEQACIEHAPDLVVVGGDVNSTLACALAAAKLHVPVAHVEAGLRSFDRSMPEEINRMLTDHIADLLFTTEASAHDNLQREGIAADRVHFVGNTMIDSLRTHITAALARAPWQQFDLHPGGYGLVTFHRPSNVDVPAARQELAVALERIAGELPLLFPVHPRTLAQSNGLWSSIAGLRITEPLGYLDFLGLMARAKVVITDSGGIQEETTALGIPCVTVRPNTERPVTVAEGTNRLVPTTVSAIVEAVFAPPMHEGRVPALWDGQAGQRIVSIIQAWLEARQQAERP